MASTYDSIIIGGGPAGLSAGIYLGRARRSVLIVDEGGGRTTWNQLNDNYFGFPKGIRAGELARRGRLQAERFGVEFRNDAVHDAKQKANHLFEVKLSKQKGRATVVKARTLIFATGVTDVWPPFPNARRYVGKSLFWCIYCDGFHAIDKRVVVLGSGDDAATIALQLLGYTPHVSFLCADVECGVSPEKQSQFKDKGIPLARGRIVKAHGKGGQLHALSLEGGQRLELDCLFSALGQVPNSQLAAGLGVQLAQNGCIQVDQEQKTNIPGVFAAGDVTSVFAQQVAAAVHEGATAAINANYFLLPRFQKDG